MPPSDRRSPRKTALLWSIVAGVVALVCVVVFVRWQTRSRWPQGDDATGKEMRALSGKQEPAPSGLDALELVKVVLVPYRFPLEFDGLYVPRDAKQPSDTMLMFGKVTNGLVSNICLPVGADLPGTKFKVDSFEYKEVTGADGKKKDVSEVTVINKETGERIVLTRQRKITGKSYAIFHCKWVQPGGQPTPDFTTQLDHTFTLPPKHDTTYKVIAIEPYKVMIEVPDGTRKTLAVPSAP